MTCDIHLTDTTHCPERVFTAHNSTPHERKVDTENMTAKGTRTSTLNILGNIRPLRYIFTPYSAIICVNPASPAADIAKAIVLVVMLKLSIRPVAMPQTFYRWL